MLVLDKAPLTAFVLIALTAACGGTVVFEEDGGQGLSGQGGNGDGGSNTSDGGSSASNNPTVTTTNVSSGPNPTVGPTSITVGPTTGIVVSASSGIPGCGTLIDDLNGLGAGAQCDGCAESACCGELANCTAGTPCWECLLGGGDCSDEGSQGINDLVNCVFNGPCSNICNGGNCNNEEFQCFETGECIPGFLLCDGEFDCEDGTDESPDVCGGCGPDAFFCNDGFCIPGDFVCDGFADCKKGEDEFCSEGICDSGLSTGDQFTDQCLSDQCCFEFEICSDFGNDVDSCFECFENGEGPLCDDAIFCLDNSGCFDQPVDDICGTGIGTGDPDADACLTDNCCDGLFNCLDQGQDECFDCFNDPDHGPVCDQFVDCACGACDVCF